MMQANCAELREDLMVAELSELHGDGDSRVAEHIRNCAACRALAAEIIDGHEALAKSLATMRAPVAAVRPISEARRRAVVWSVPLAAAAMIALLLVNTESNELPNVEPITRLLFRATPLVTPAPGRQALILEKDEMTIVWLYPEEKL